MKNVHIDVTFMPHHDICRLAVDKNYSGRNESVQKLRGSKLFSLIGLRTDTFSSLIFICTHKHIGKMATRNDKKAFIHLKLQTVEIGKIDDEPTANDENRSRQQRCMCELR